MKKILVFVILATFGSAPTEAQVFPGNPPSAVTPFQATGNGATTSTSSAARAGTYIDAKSDFGLKGDTVSFVDGTIAAASTSLSSAAHPCVAADVGKSLTLHGSGTSALPQKGTVIGCSGNAFIPSFTSVNATPWNGSWSATVATAQSGSGSYAPADTLTCAGGTGVVTNCLFTVSTTKLASATVNAGGTGGTNGACTVTGTTGTGTKFQASGTVTVGVFTGPLTVSGSIPGSYTVNPTSLIAEPVTGCSLVGATLTINMGVATVASAVGGQFTSMPTPNTVTTSGAGTGAILNIVGTLMGGQFTLGTDDTANFALAVASAVVNNLRLYLPAGGYWLASQTSAINLTGAQIFGDGWPSDFYPFNGGSMLLLSNPTTNAFSGMANVTLRDVSIYYPGIDNTQTTPVSYPPTFESAGFLDVTFNHVRFLNAYDLFKVDPGGSGWGRVFLDGMMSYCVDRCFWFLNGAGDVPELGATNYWGQGAFGSIPLTGPAYLSRYSEGSGEFIRIDSGAGSYPSIDGLIMTGGIINGYRYGIRILSGVLDVSNISNVNWDQVGSVVSVEGTGSLITTQFSGGEIYSTNVWNSAQAANVFNNTSTTGASVFSLSGIHSTYSQGSFVADTVSGLAGVVATGNTINSVGQSTTVNAYSAFYLNASNARLHIVGNSETCSGTGNTNYFLFLTGFSYGNVKDNTISSCGIDFYDNRSNGSLPLSLAGNATFATVFRSIQVSATVNSLFEFDNRWDKLTAAYGQPALTSGWGAGATQTTYSTDNLTRITVGTTPASPAVLTFNWTKNTPPVCVAIDETTSTTLTAVATTTTVTVTGTKAASDVVSVSCRPTT